MSPKSFAVTGGTVDPTTGEGNLTYSGKLKFKNRQNGKKIAFKGLAATLGTGGKLTGKTGGKTVKVMTLSGGTITRQGFGADITDITARLTRKAAKKINRKLELDSLHKGKVGTTKVSEQPSEVELIAGGQADLTPDLAIFAGKFPKHCIDPTPGNGGVEVIAPATETVALPPILHFPLTGGNVAPDLSSGSVKTAGGAKIAKNITGPISGTETCPSGTQSMTLTDINVDLGIKRVFAHTVLADAPAPAPNGDLGNVAIGNLDLSSATIGIDPATRKFFISGAKVLLDETSAGLLNLVFPLATGSDAVNNFAAGDSLGSVEFTATAH